MQNNTISGHGPTICEIDCAYIWLLRYDFCVLTKRPNHCRLAPPALTMIHIGGMASGPSECRACHPQMGKPEGSSKASTVQPRWRAWIKKKTIGLGGAPCSQPRAKKHAAVSPKRLPIDRKDQEYNWQMSLMSAAVNPLASRTVQLLSDLVSSHWATLVSLTCSPLQNSFHPVPRADLLSWLIAGFH